MGLLVSSLLVSSLKGGQGHWAPIPRRMSTAGPTNATRISCKTLIDTSAQTTIKCSGPFGEVLPTLQWRAAQQSLCTENQRTLHHAWLLPGEGLRSRNHGYSATLAHSNYHRGAMGRGLGKKSLKRLTILSRNRQNFSV